MPKFDAIIFCPTGFDVGAAFLLWRTSKVDTLSHFKIKNNVQYLNILTKCWIYLIYMDNNKTHFCLNEPAVAFRLVKVCNKASSYDDVSMHNMVVIFVYPL